jgi:hypothetical protein
MSIATQPGEKPRISIVNRHQSVPEDTIRDFCRKWNLISFRFYGSIMRDDFRPDSDIDMKSKKQFRSQSMGLRVHFSSLVVSTGGDPNRIRLKTC